MRHKSLIQQKIIGYVRISSDEQHLSVESQRAEVERWCHAHQMPLVAVYEDVGIGGGVSLEKRPGLLAALAALSRGRALLVVRRDRLARDTLTAAMAERIAAKAGASILTLTGTGDGDTPDAVLMCTMIDAFARYERALIAMWAKAGLQRKRAKGDRIGEVPYGKPLAPDAIHWIDHAAEHAVITTVPALRAEGLSYRAIVTQLQRSGLTNLA